MVLWMACQTEIVWSNDDGACVAVIGDQMEVVWSDRRSLCARLWGCLGE